MQKLKIMLICSCSFVDHLLGSINRKGEEEFSREKERLFTLSWFRRSSDYESPFKRRKQNSSIRDICIANEKKERSQEKSSSSHLMVIKISGLILYIRRPKHIKQYSQMHIFFLIKL